LLFQPVDKAGLVQGVPERAPSRCGGSAARIGKEDQDGPQARRLLALAAIYDGATRSEAAKIADG